MTSRVIDWKDRRRGNDYTCFPTTEDGDRIKMVGWRTGLQKGDLLGLRHGDSHFAAYEIVSIRYKSDPADMFSADLKYQPGALKLDGDGNLVAV